MSWQYWKARRQGREWQALKLTGRPFGLSQAAEPLIYSMLDDVIGRALFDSGTWEFEKFEYVHGLLGKRRIPRLIDVGAQIGVITIPALARGFVDRAIAVEPDPLNFRLLECNVCLNDLQQTVLCIQAAVTRYGDCAVMLERSSNNHGDHRISSRNGHRASHGSVVPVAGVRLDDVVDAPSRENDLVWMDVQGYEVEALLGAPRLLEAGVPLVLEIWPHGLAEHDSLSAFPEVLGGYTSFVDLADTERIPRPISAIVDLYEEYGLDGRYTDILVT